MSRTYAFLLGLTLSLMSAVVARADVEFFLKIDDGGRYTVVIDEQSITLNTGRFRFFELPAGRNRVAILRNNYPVFQDWIDLRPDSRTVAEFHPRRGLRLLTQFPLFDNGMYCGPNWDQPYASNRPDYGRPGNGRPDNWNNRPGSGLPGSGRPGNGNGNWGNNRPYEMNPRDFDRIRQGISRESFDERKFEFLRNVLPGQPVSTAQMCELLRMFSFDKYRLEAAKVGWECVSDRNNYYATFDTFSFESSRRDLKQHIGWRLN
ncbi:DUF4476 domain-containing protein [Tellurirhabdus rosea]|uniref:DUF4476 domain-containing protein n=1 Tax=Tellurirhabdus rosea TaxID=2674997 RepID=UPI00224D5ECF|nr:DUF4476 domain-containing protein [Tellurirhabdus rosea]